jgi:predicted regulator of Ras-like GTPase activity (Roadblock/LC7/MglB family)
MELTEEDIDRGLEALGRPPGGPTGSEALAARKTGAVELVGRLMRLDGVAGAIVVSRQGQVLASATERDPEWAATVALFLGGAARVRRREADLYDGPGRLEQALVESGGERLLILEAGDGFVAVDLSLHASSELLLPAVRALLS